MTQRFGTGHLDVIIVEDNALIALDLQFLLEDLGHRCIGKYARSGSAMRAAAERRPDVGLIDLNLADVRTGHMVVEKLSSLGIPCIVISGEARHNANIGKALAVLEKPVNTEVLRRILDEIGGKETIPTE